MLIFLATDMFMVHTIACY